MSTRVPNPQSWDGNRRVAQRDAPHTGDGDRAPKGGVVAIVVDRVGNADRRRPSGVSQPAGNYVAPPVVTRHAACSTSFVRLVLAWIFIVLFPPTPTTNQPLAPMSASSSSSSARVSLQGTDGLTSEPSLNEPLPTRNRREPPPDLPVHPAVLELLKKPYFPQHSPEWHHARGRHLTASRIATVLDRGPSWDSKERYKRELVAIQLGLPPSTELDCNAREAVEWGTHFEPFARAEFEQVTGMMVFEFGLVEHPSYPWLAGSPDGATHLGHLLEIKCAFRRRVERQRWPPYYWDQVQMLMAVTGLPYAYGVQYVPPVELRRHLRADDMRQPVLDIVPISKDDEWLERALPRLQQFWQEIEQEVSRRRQELLPKELSPIVSPSPTTPVVPEQKGKKRPRPQRPSFLSLPTADPPIGFADSSTSTEEEVDEVGEEEAAAMDVAWMIGKLLEWERQLAQARRQLEKSTATDRIT